MKRIAAVLVFMALALTASAQKRVSILGDSYSTFAGHMPRHHDIWYPNENGNDVTEVEQTWWNLLISGDGYQLEKNNSWSGSTICNTGYNGDDYSDRSFFSRVNMLGNPDIILIFGGTNDSWAGSPIGEYQYKNWDREDLYSFRPALAYLLSELKALYPSAEIYFMLNSELSAEINESTFKICGKYDIPVIVLKDIDKQWGHPSVKGMKAICDQVSEFIR